MVAGNTFGKIKALENSAGKRIPKAGPATAVVILGLTDVPEAGDVLRVVKDVMIARDQVEARKNAAAAAAGGGSGRATLEDLYKQIQAGQAKELRIILKADVSGSLGAISHALQQLSDDEVKINVLLEAAGDITDNDIMLATASNAIVVGFNTGITDTARREPPRRGRRRPPLRHHLQAHGRHRRGPQGHARAGDRGGRSRAGPRSARSSGSARRTVIAGCFVTDGRIVRTGGARVYRGGKVIATDKIDSLRRFRDDVREVARTSSAASASPGSTTWRRATSSSASPAVPQPHRKLRSSLAARARAR